MALPPPPPPPIQYWMVSSFSIRNTLFIVVVPGYVFQGGAPTAQMAGMSLVSTCSLSACYVIVGGLGENRRISACTCTSSDFHTRYHGIVLSVCIGHVEAWAIVAITTCRDKLLKYWLSNHDNYQLTNSELLVIRYNSKWSERKKKTVSKWPDTFNLHELKMMCHSVGSNNHWHT